MDKELIREVVELLALERRGTKQNRRFFEIYNGLTGENMRACFCSAKVEKIKKYLLEWMEKQIITDGN